MHHMVERHDAMIYCVESHNACVMYHFPITNTVIFYKTFYTCKYMCTRDRSSTLIISIDIHSTAGTSSARSSTGACIRLLRCTFKTCACQSQPPPVVVTCVQLLVVTYKSWRPKLLRSGHAALLRVPPNPGTAYHCHSAIRH